MKYGFKNITILNQIIDFQLFLKKCRKGEEKRYRGISIYFLLPLIDYLLIEIFSI
jgi:hypothetical protein